MINLQLGLYKRSGGLISAIDLGALTGLGHGALSDPQVIWDPATNRFYYSVLDFNTGTIAWGFSRSSAPTFPSSDFCNYNADFGYQTTRSLPDYPKLGDTRDFLLIGVNVFSFIGTYRGSDVDWITKPSGTAGILNCPPASAFALGHRAALKNPDGSFVSTPVPAVQTDSSGTGWVVGTPDVGAPGLTASYVTLFRVSRSSAGGARIQATGTALPVASYSLPPSAPQAGSNNTLDTLDGRLEHAMSSIDPATGSMAVWTAHAVLGGAGSEERWYEIDPAMQHVVRSGSASDPSLYVWNGAVSSDRAVRGSTASFGDDMVMGFDTSSSSTDAAIQMVSERGSAPQSAFVLVTQSAGPDIDSSCSYCRWGDYSGASPDPAAPTAAGAGQVWMSGEWNAPATDGQTPCWRTWNWAALP